MPNFRDWFSVSAAAAPVAMLFSMAFGIFVGTTMSGHVEFWWVFLSVAIAMMLWFNGAKTQQREREAREREREAREHERAIMLRFDTIEKLLHKPGITLEDIKAAMAIGNADGKATVLGRSR